jgi:hypothetical protein
MNEFLGIGTWVLTAIGTLYVSIGLVDLLRPLPKQRP